MLSFKDYTYLRPDMEQFAADFEALRNAFEKANSAQAQYHFLEKINRLRNAFLTAYNLCYIRHSINTKDQFYEAENRWFDENLPKYEEQVARFYKVLLASPFREKLTQLTGNQLFVLAQMSVKVFSPEIIPELIEENKLGSEYMQLKAGAQLEVEGKIYNLSSITAIEESTDRGLRKKAADAKWAFYQAHHEKIEDIFDRMVKVRTRMAQKLGFDNYIEMGYLRMNRSGYDHRDVEKFRNAVLKNIVPIASRLYERQRQRLGLDTLKYYDLSFNFKSGNPKPTGTPEEIIQATAQMYDELSPETGSFFRFMREGRLLDLVARDGKATGGYCTFIPNYGSPFIFSNFNGTDGDIVVMTHEAGHAFQVFSSRDMTIPEYHWPTYEAAEIHSMSMEFFTFPWMDLFFEQAGKYRFAHLAAAVKFIPYGVAVDEFQHRVYQNPELTPGERNAAWLEIQRKYMPHFNPEDNEFLNAGRMWQRQSHIFKSPFYYIDYALAQICAFQFWKRDTRDHSKAWQDYLRLCRAGGSRPFLELVALAGLRSPFQNEVLKETAEHVEAFLNSIDDRNF